MKFNRKSLPKLNKRLALLSMSAALLVMQGCAVHNIRSKVDDAANSGSMSGDDARASLLNQVRESKERRLAESDVGVPYIAGKSVPLPRQLSMPPALSRNVPVEVMFQRADSLTLQEAASFISTATQIPVRVGPDALLPAEAFLPRAGTTVGGSAGASSPQGNRGVGINMRLKEMPLMSLLDYLANQSGTSWKWDNGAILFYRLETRTFRLKTLSQKVSTSSGLGRNSGSSQLFESSGTTRIEMKDADPVAAARVTIEALMSRAGTIAISLETGSVVVNDTKDALDRIEAHINNENKSMTRRVKLIFETVEVQNNKSGENGIDWNVVFKKINLEDATSVATSGVSAGKLAPLGTTVNTNASGITLNLLGNTRYAGTSVVLKAIAEQGRIFNKSTIPMSTLNRRPISHAVRTTFNYVDQIQNNSSTTSTGSTNQAAPSVTQKEETVGTLITMVPDASEDGTIVMSIAFDSTVLTSLQPFSVGNGSNTMTVQQKVIDGTGTLQQIVMRSGQTAVISGFEKISDNYKERRMDEHAPMLLGGSDSAASQRITKVLLVTAVAEEGI
jgi:type IVB pilus formation R64 PilN family outer membrane protein